MLGREGPSIQLGAAIGQCVAKYRHLSHNKSKSLIASGAAAGLSAAFNAPLAGVMFVLEVLAPNPKTGVITRIIVHNSR
ncbi:chloride channel protein [Leuconostoc lactis]|nr:chloride channel protein [Leuconostoc lactis]MDN2650116.1 chloride channel protein [Leuconostoc lactis]